MNWKYFSTDEQDARGSIADGFDARYLGHPADRRLAALHDQLDGLVEITSNR